MQRAPVDAYAVEMLVERRPRQDFLLDGTHAAQREEAVARPRRRRGVRDLLHAGLLHLHGEDADVAASDRARAARAQLLDVHSDWRLADRALLGLIQRHFAERVDLAAERLDLERLLAPGVVRDAEGVFAGSCAAGDHAQPRAAHVKELLRAENLLEAAADARLERIGLWQWRIDFALQGRVGQRPGLNAEGAREEGHLPPAARHRRIDGLGLSSQATGQRGEVGRGDDDVPAALGVGLELVPGLAAAPQRSRHDHHRIPLQHPPGRVAQQAIRQVAVGRRREEARFVVEVRRVLVSGIEQVEHRVGQIVARLVGEVAPRAVDGAPVHVPRDGPSGIEVEEQGHGRVHDPALAMGRDPALGGLLNLADGSELLVREPAALEADRDAVGEDMRVEQTLHQTEAGAERRPVCVAGAAGRGVVGLVAPAIEDRDVAEPRHAVLLARAPDERVGDLVIR